MRTWVLFLAAAFALCSVPALAQRGGRGGSGYGYGGGHYSGGSHYGSGGPVFVHGYTRRDGTYVGSYYRAAPGEGLPRITGFSIDSYAGYGTLWARTGFHWAAIAISTSSYLHPVAVKKVDPFKGKVGNKAIYRYGGWVDGIDPNRVYNSPIHGVMVSFEGSSAKSGLDLVEVPAYSGLSAGFEVRAYRFGIDEPWVPYTGWEEMFKAISSHKQSMVYIKGREKSGEAKETYLFTNDDGHWSGLEPRD